jgi:SAM-dependent methyltransferase
MRERKARDDDSDHYDATISAGHNAIEIQAIVSALSPRSDETVVDLGAGTGRLTVALAIGGARVIAVDLSPRSLLINRRKCAEAGVAQRVVHIVADACRLPLRDSSIEKLGSGMLLEHISPADERKRCIDEIHRVLRNGGRMALTAYNYSWTMSRRRAPREGTHEGDLYFYRLDRREMAGMLAGFKKSRVSGILNLPGRFAMPALDRVVSGLPALATRSGDLLFAVASR